MVRGGWLRLVALGNPAIARTSLGDCSPQTTELGGFSLIEADDVTRSMATRLNSEARRLRESYDYQ